jgi:hypothetical protein
MRRKEASMSNEQSRELERQPALIDLGAATELTQGTFMPKARESVVVQDYFDEP